MAKEFFFSDASHLLTTMYLPHYLAVQKTKQSNEFLLCNSQNFVSHFVRA